MSIRMMHVPLLLLAFGLQAVLADRPSRRYLGALQLDAPASTVTEPEEQEVHGSASGTKKVSLSVSSRSAIVKHHKSHQAHHGAIPQPAASKEKELHEESAPPTTVQTSGRQLGDASFDVGLALGVANAPVLLELGEVSATEAGLNASAHSAATSGMIPGVPMGSMMKYAAYCFVCICIYKFISSIDIYSRKLDPRRCKPIAKFLRESGYDEFDPFDVRVQVHCISDVANQGMMGGKKNFQVDLQFYWSKFSTTPVSDMKWEQTKAMHVPQGASVCFIQLIDVGTLTNAVVGTYEFDTKFHMLDKEDFWGKKQKVKLRDEADKEVGKLMLTFYKKGEGGSDIPIDGVDEDSPLAMDLIKEWQVMQDTPGFVKPPDGKLKGVARMELLAKMLQGTLREIDGKGKDKGLTYVRVMHCNFAELQGDNMEKEMAKQVKKAKEKGLPDIQKKWYFVWYENEKKADDDKKRHYPDGFIPLVSITSLHRSPERDDQFLFKYSGGKTDVLIYRNEKKERALGTWIDALDILFVEARDLVKKEKEEEKRLAEALGKMRKMHEEYVQGNGFPQTEEQWKSWYTHYENNNYPSDYVKILYTEIMKSAPPPAPASSPAAPAGGDGDGDGTAEAGEAMSKAKSKRMPPPAPKSAPAGSPAGEGRV